MTTNFTELTETLSGWNYTAKEITEGLTYLKNACDETGDVDLFDEIMSEVTDIEIEECIIRANYLFGYYDEQTHHEALVRLASRGINFFVDEDFYWDDQDAHGYRPQHGRKYLGC